jgi:DNA-binding SARP family transcriptional activator
MPIEFRILGPLEVSADGRLLTLGSPKQRALLGLLLVHANETVARDRLIEELWAEAAPATVESALHVYLSRLRRLLNSAGASGALVRQAHGYTLRVEPEQLDANRFGRLVGEGSEALATGKAELAAERLREALALWRGPPFADLQAERFAATAGARLEEERVSALEQRLEADLALGRHREVIGELETLVAEHPYRERLRAQLMLALYRSGRQADALRAYQVGRRTLADELGLEPGQELKELEQAILRQDESVATAPPRRPRVFESVEAEPPQRAREARKVVTVLFSDVVRSTELGETTDPEAVRRVMFRWYEAMRAVIEGHGGAVEKFAGDEMMAVFGVPAVHEDDAVRAARAAAEMRERLTALNDELEASAGVRLAARIGINTGQVVAGDLSSGHTFVTGDAVNLARRLEQTAGADEIVIGEATYALVRDAVTAGPLEPIVVKGKRKPVTSFRVDAVSAAASGRALRLDAPMVGRQPELRLLRDAFERSVNDRRCHLLTVLGAAGVGKSRLMLEFLRSLGSQAAVLRGHCLPYGEGITYWPLGEVVRQAAGLRGDEPGAVARSRIAALLEGEEHAGPAGDRIAQLVGLSEAAGGSDEGFWAARKLFEAIARERPLILVFEDMERAEPGFLDLIEHVTDVSRERPILLTCVARLELLEARPSWAGGKLNATSVLLEPLGEEDVVLLVGRLFEGALDPAVSSRVLEVAAGNPLFVEEYAAMLLEQGLLERKDARWSAATELAALPMPPSIQALLAARIDQLPESERAVLERAAVEGMTFHVGSVAALSDDGVRDEVGLFLTSLLRQELVQPDRSQFSGEDGFRFRHLLIRDAAYESIPKELRADLHERLAGWLEERAAESRGDYDEILGHHLEQAFRYRSELGPPDEWERRLAMRAAEHLSSAGRRAEQRGDWRAAVNLLSRAVALYGPSEAARDLLPPLIDAAFQSGDLPRARALTADAREQAADAGDVRLEAWTRVQHAQIQLAAQERTAEEIFAEAKRALEAFEELGDYAGLARAWELVADVHSREGKASASVAALGRAIREAKKSGDLRLEVRAETEMTSYLLYGPTAIDDAVAQTERALERARGQGDLSSVGYLVSRLARLYAARGQFAEARVFHAEARSLAEEIGAGYILHGRHLALIEMLAGNPNAAEDSIRPELDALRKTGDKLRLAIHANVLGSVLCAQRRYDEAEQLSREAESASAPDELTNQVGWRTVRARVFAARGELGPAESLAREALALAASGEYVDSHAYALICLGEILHQVGRREEATRHVEKARRLWERKGNVVMAAKARGVLDETLAAARQSGS